MVESRTVLGAAVADDVIGLVILTVVVRLATSGSVSVLGVLWIVFVAVAFLAVDRVRRSALRARGFFDWIARHSRSSGTLVATRARVHARDRRARERRQARADRRGVRRRPRPRSQQLVRSHPPGAAAGRAPLHPGVLPRRSASRSTSTSSPSRRCSAIAAVLFVIAVAGKLAAGSGDDRFARRPPPRRDRHDPARRGRADLRDDRAWRKRSSASATTRRSCSWCFSPRSRLRRCCDHVSNDCERGPRPRPGRRRRDPRGDGSRSSDGRGGIGRRRSRGDAHRSATRSTSACKRRSCSTTSTDPVSVSSTGSASCRRLLCDSTAAPVETFFTLLERGRPRSWRFLQITGLLDRALPELGEAIARREPSALDLDPFGALHWATLDAVHRELADRVARRRLRSRIPSGSSWRRSCSTQRRLRAAGPARSSRDATPRSRCGARTSGGRSRGRRRPAAGAAALRPDASR